MADELDKIKDILGYSKGNINPNDNLGRLGMNMDNTPNQINKGVVSYALNAAVENFDANSVNYQNEPGNELCFDFPEGYQLIGKHFIQEKNKHVFFITNPETGDSEIGFMENNDCVYRTYISAKCLNFNIDYPIHKSVHKITNCSTQIYWTDGFNSRRYVDLESPPWINKPGTNVCDNELVPGIVDCNKIKVQPNYDIPQLSVLEVRNDGQLTAGSYQFAIQYCDSGGEGYTSYHSITNPTPIADPLITTLNFDYIVGKSILLNISNIDVTGYFQYFNLAVIKTVNSITSVELLGTYFIDDTDKKILYTGQNVENIRLSINDIFEKFPFYDVAQDVTSVRDILVWDNLQSNQRVNYQQIANQIELLWETWRIPSGENYADELNATNLRGYLRDEVYAFEIVFLLRNGKQTDGFHIPGRIKNSFDNYPDVPETNNDFIGEPDYVASGVGFSPYWKIYNTGYKIGDSPDKDPSNPKYKGPWEYGGFGYWESTDVYPCNDEVWGDLANQPIRHHKFPDLRVSPIHESPTIVYSNGQIVPVITQDAIYPIGVRIDNNQILNLISSSNLTDQQKDDIVGYKIVRGDRSTNKSIIAKGILRNVGKYRREETDYYYPNYPYNDLGKDPFLLSENNAYYQSCKSHKITPTTVPLVVEYLDCRTNELTTKTYTVSGVTEYLCAQSFPQILSGTASFLGLADYKTYKIDNNNVIFGWRYAYKDPTSPSVYSQGWLCSQTAGLFSNCDEVTIDSVEPPVAILNPLTNTAVIDPDNIVNNPAGFRVSIVAEYVSPVDCGTANLDQLDGFVYSDQGYRHVFNSPETSFGQPFLGQVLKLETAIFGAGKAHFVEVRDNAKYKLLTKEAQEDALSSSYNIATVAGSFDAAAMFTTYQAYLTIYINGITRRNYGYSFNSIASYDYWSIIENNQPTPSGLGIKQRPLSISQYLIPGVQNVGDDFNINNFQRESSVYLKTDTARTALPYPNQTTSLLSGTTSLISDNTRFTIGDYTSTRGTDCANPEKVIDTKVVAYYGSIKNLSVDQWGQMYSYQTIDTGFQRDIDSVPPIETIFGGDTFISRFAFKTKLPFFIDNRVNAPDDSDIFYDEIGNVAYPKYWHSARSVLYNYTAGTTVLSNLISIKASFLDCPNSQTPKENNPGRTYYDGKMYMFAYGIPSFYCESSINVDLRQAFNNREGDFWPHVSTGIPDNWLQETFVPIAQDNTYFYNASFSKQNKENLFTHLPVDWDSDDQCFTFYPFRAIYSDAQQDFTDNSINSWLIYRPVSFFDFPQNYGNLTSLDGIQNKNVLARFENKTLLYNNLLTIDTSNPQAAYIGNDKLFASAPPIDFAETDLGYIGSQHKFLLKIPQGQITIDAKRGNIFLITGDGAKDLSAFGSGMNRFFTDHLAFEILRYFPNVNVDNHFKNIGLHGVYDSKYERIIITKLDYIPLVNNIVYDTTDQEFYIVETVANQQVRTQIYVTDEEYFCNKSWSISFNFNTMSWVSFHSYLPNWYIGENNFFYSGLNGGCYIEAFAGEVLAPTTTTTSSTIIDPCSCISFQNFDVKSHTYGYTECKGNINTSVPILAGQVVQVCGKDPVVSDPLVLFVIGAPCVTDPDTFQPVCTITTTTANPAVGPCAIAGTVTEVPEPTTSSTSSSSTSTSSTSSTTSTTTTVCVDCDTYILTNTDDCPQSITVTNCLGITETTIILPGVSILLCSCDVPILPITVTSLLVTSGCSPCFCYTLVNTSSSNQTVYYSDCDNNFYTVVLAPDEEKYICSIFESQVVPPEVTITRGAPCTSLFGCDPCATTSSSTTT